MEKDLLQRTVFAQEGRELSDELANKLAKLR